MEFLPEKDQKRGILYPLENGTAKTIMVLGKSKSGKTHFITDQINKLEGKTRIEDGVVRPLYDKIIIMTESLNAEPFQRLSSSLPIIFLKGYVAKSVLLLKRINDEVKNKLRFLIILDDCTGTTSGKSLRGGLFVKQMLTLRNANITTVVLVQSATLLEPKTRENAHCICVTGLKIKDKKRCVDELMYDEARKYLGFDKRGERLAIDFFDLVGTNILVYDNLENKAFLYPREPFKSK